ncbi:MAG: hypothetical protein LBE06_06340 [Azoarcus sp.]|jgi:ABC-type sulfate transport system permease subunit|nr:hypothetical protein [Azoarcus sp.]
MKQNFFADIEDFMDDDGIPFVAGLFAFLLFVGLWIAGGSFWFALIATAVIGPTIGGLAALFVFGVSMMFGRCEEDADIRYMGVARFFFALPLLIVSGAFLYAFFPF